MNNPYQTPIMNNYLPQYGAYQYNPMANVQRFQSQEQIQPQIQQSMPQQIAGINGRIVQAVENINANEVPMDGSMAFFPKQDLSEIYVKGWNANGTINTIVYKPYTEPNNNQTVNSMVNAENAKFTLSDESTEVFMKKFDEIFNKFEELESKISKNSTSQRKTSTAKGE